MKVRVEMKNSKKDACCRQSADARKEASTYRLILLGRPSIFSFKYQ